MTRLAIEARSADTLAVHTLAVIQARRRAVHGCFVAAAVTAEARGAYALAVIARPLRRRAVLWTCEEELTVVARRPTEAMVAAAAPRFGARPVTRTGPKGRGWATQGG